MLRNALRRSVWFVPALLLASFLFFWLLTLVAPTPDPSLPRFFNLYPRDIKTLTDRAVRSLAEGPNEGAQRELVRLGGAAFPHILPLLHPQPPVRQPIDTSPSPLDSQTQGRIAMALEPVAKRMGLTDPSVFSSPSNAIAFWNRFWEERSVEFQPAAVRRAVHRQAAHGSPARLTTLIELDTFALQGIMQALDTCHTPDDVARSVRLLSVAAHVTQRDACIHPRMDPHQANRCILVWRDWWLSSRFDYEPLSGPERLFAILTETQYGRWALEASTFQLGVDANGMTTFARFRYQGPSTFALAFFGLWLAYALAFPMSLAGALHHERTVDKISSGVLLALLTAPVALICFILAWIISNPIAIAITAIGTTLVVAPARHQRIAALDSLSNPCLQYAAARGIPRSQIVLFHIGKPSLALAVTLFAFDFPIALSAACVAEQALGLPGLGHHLIDAVIERDIPLLMAMGLIGMTVHALMMFLGSLLGNWLDPRLDRSVHGEYP